MHELRGDSELSLEQALRQLSPCDLVLIEGYKRAAIPKLEIHRARVGKPLLYPDDPNIIGLATDTPDAFVMRDIPVLDLSNAGAICELVMTRCSELVIDNLPLSL